ncbi:hypothetical protein GDO86_011384 [Hymenochirus boettgeri]|uniref:Ribosomal protein n=1 Tax=Hymenochirus boettgeri TaxID=247094 RepID=A0A8T2JG66_9PIPI|nr:hypothetical protein GDO86_011384 [Hymenochirus boettgeri]KAG8442571.1 hypothetical protein GDO86_011384 [Hymenochirus boettgeri]KAG8442572.1 hypothetical protein GDO86_011384 [Hymenochirus boettgeri]KAG8442573.1 hypothetical protein GDO86_011384 [Hymenochirus boettgeri]
MASFFLQRALLYITKHALVFGQHSATFSSISAATNVIQSIARKNIMEFRTSRFLVEDYTQMVQQTCGMKTKSALKKRCKDCFFVRRRGRLYIYCKSNGKHKQRQG